ncbi:uncharacterized protein LOC115624820 [Scaptodrosophila lebanonensis]|uniref:Uncharacterized protein LOC115624820 n=1 Tax=Drosophila lebanonensis TaxID=7225 RepID=A0A6J2TK60_DROLE|nr:uncharacterized protein LOC115624820 [Scaptodrosophila lebanonensis]
MLSSLNEKIAAVALLFALCLTHMAEGQRPSFAGARPPGGLHQKDKYHGTQNTAAENITGLGIANRFGSDAVQRPEISTLAYGASQSPPMGVDWVTPEATYVPIAFPASSSTATAGAAVGTGASASPSGSPQFGIVNRFGAAENNSNTPNSISGSTVPAAGVVPLPIDAHNDLEFVNHLNRLPIDKQPFWFINYQAIEAQRNSSRANVNALETRGSFFGG